MHIEGKILVLDESEIVKACQEYATRSGHSITKIFGFHTHDGGISMRLQLKQSASPSLMRDPNDERDVRAHSGERQKTKGATGTHITVDKSDLEKTEEAFLKPRQK